MNTPDAALQGAVAQARRWYWQRISAMVLALCVVLHLAGMVWAVRGGLTAAEILSRTQGNGLFAVFYAVFVLACAVHVPIGLAATSPTSGGACRCRLPPGWRAAPRR